MNSTKPRTQFAIQSRILHWLMAAMILAMLFIGVPWWLRWPTIAGSSRFIGRSASQFSSSR